MSRLLIILISFVFLAIVKGCKTISENQPSIIVRKTDGQLGNIMNTYAYLLGLKLKYNFDVYGTKENLTWLKNFFEHIQMEAAEDVICHFQEDYEILVKQLKEAEIEIMKEHSKTHILSEISEREKVLHGGLLWNIENVQMPNWIFHQNETLESLENLRFGHKIFAHFEQLLYPELLDYPGVKTELKQSFKLRPKYLQMANETITKIMKKRKAKILIGIHVRRNDYLSLARVQKKSELKASYYLSGMDMYRQKYGSKKVTFLLITDDIAWCQKHLTKNFRDLFIVSSLSRSHQDSIGHDLGVMSYCQHALISHGSFSGWISFMTEGDVISPYK